MTVQTRYASKDAFMGLGDGVSGWNGEDNHLLIGGTDFSNTFRSCVYFSIDFSPMDSVSEAILTLVSSGGVHLNQTSAPSSVNGYRMTKDWAEGGYNPGEGELAFGMEYSYNNRFDKYTVNGAASASWTLGAVDTEEFIDVTDIVRDWKNGAQQYGFMLVNTSSEYTSSKGMSFFSRQAGGSRRPRLEITYTSNTAPNAPTIDDPRDGETKHTLVPTFSGTRSDANANDVLTGVQIETYYAGSKYLYSQNTSSSDPGSGGIKCNSTTPASVTAVYINETDAESISTVTQLANVSLSAIRIQNMGTPSQYFLANIDSFVDNGAWRTLTVSGSSGSLISASADVLVTFIMSQANQSFGWLYWSSGIISITGGPISFSRQYGGQGSAIPLIGNRYFSWRAKTRDIGNLWGPWSNTHAFKANSQPSVPTVVLLASPIADNTPNVTLTHGDDDPGDNRMTGYRVVVEEAVPGFAPPSYISKWDSGDVVVSPVVSKIVTIGTLNWGY